MDEQNKKSDAALREEKVLEFWRANKIFEKSLEQTKKGKEYVFYDGPVTANSKPVLHTMVPFTFKDAIPRYKTMQGYHVRRKGGWDTHGLPVELQIEKKLGFKSKVDIENYGIEAFNKLCKDSVWEYVGMWKSFTERMGYWADQENPYVTYHNDYIESVWNILKTVEAKKLLYKDYKVVPWCPRCGTALSSHELAQGYEEVKDLSVYAKFKIVGTTNGYFLAWTTTPWTLPGNVALAVGKDIVYVEAKVANGDSSEILVLAKDRLSILPEGYEIVAEHKGSEMVGMEYEPLFNFIPKNDKAYKVYTADFVNTTDGTGIVHTAVMYGQDDFELGTKVGLPKYHLVNPEGKFIKGTGFLEGRFVREVNADGKPTLAVDIIEDLKKQNLFFKQENYKHQYPHCWRCKTALIYYARDSWYIRMSDPKIKKQLISENKKINWEPAYTRDGRFGEWLREIKDWAISRERYWGTPLPAWLCGKCGERHIVGSIEELKKKTKKSGNKYFMMRHGEAENNVSNVYSSEKDKNPLTEKGRSEAAAEASKLKKKKVTKIFASPFLRAKETAEIIAEGIGFSKDKIIYDDRIAELNFGEVSGKHSDEYWKYVKSKDWKFDSRIPGGESLQDVKNRIGSFLYDLEKKYSNETILVVAHGIEVEMFPIIAAGLDQSNSLLAYHSGAMKAPPGSLHQESTFVLIPHNADYELDFHRPFIDEVVLVCDCGGDMVRVKEVMDVWLDSGAMPFAQDHYPFSTRNKLLYPADFISEGIDQTRGWFYTLHAVGTLMGRGLAYKNVICLGHLLDAAGKKMSKSLGNIVDPTLMMDKYGVDTLRLWMYSVNQPGESKNFDEKTVVLLHQQVFTLLYNVLAFYELYRDKNHEQNIKIKSKNVLDLWIIARLNELSSIATENLDNYKLLEPTRAVRDFVGDLSTWYLRRSRERIKEGDVDAKQTLYFVLKTLVKIMAPFVPFSAEDIWLKLKNEKDEESVHLALWPKAGKIDEKIIEEMAITRELVSIGLDLRQKAKIQVRQPLLKFSPSFLKHNGVKGFDVLQNNYTELIKDELNVKEVVFLKNISRKNGTSGLFLDKSPGILDTNIAPELKAEGYYRELVRAIQDIRKRVGLTPSDVVTLYIETDDNGRKLIQHFGADLQKVVLASKIEFTVNNSEPTKVGDLVFKVKIAKI